MDSFLDESESQSIVPASSASVASVAAAAATVSSSSSSSTTSCTSISMKFNDATVIVSVIILCLINVIVIAGNILVIVSVFTSAKLRTVTNFFIVSLAVADLLVGIAVLPYSVTNEILDVWVFGEIWCQGWLATDVWMCTASILNLCAISVDRYLAVTRPVRYRSIMTSKRAKLFIAAVWVLSFIICFPPLVGWNDVQPQTQQSQSQSQPYNPIATTTASTLKVTLPYNYNFNHNHNHNHHTTTTTTTTSSPTNANFMLNMSSSESTLMSTLSIPHDNDINTYLFETSNSSNDLDIDSDSNSNPNPNCDTSRIKCALFNNKGYVIYSALGSFYIPMFVMIFFYWRIYLVASRTSRALKRGYIKTTKCNGSRSERLTLRMHRGLGDEVQSNYGYTTTTNTTTSTYLSTQCNDTNFNTLTTTAVKTSPVSPKSRSVILKQTLVENQSDDQKLQSKSSTSSSTHHERHNSSGGKRQMPITLYRSSRLTANLDPSSAQNGGNRRMSPSNQSTLSLPSSSSPSSSREGSARSSKLAMTRYSKRTSKYQAKRFHAETKAAKTVGIIVGGFILCWLPFFTVYLARVFCDNDGCIPDLLFSIFIWLGYCNSMINPCIYGLFSKDFRRAFKNIICRCKFSEETVSSLIRQIHMPTFFEDMPEDIMKPESQEY